MTRDEVMEKAVAAGWVVEKSLLPDWIGVRQYKADDPHERMRLCANGALLVQGDDGYMWQWGTIEDVEKALEGK